MKSTEQPCVYCGEPGTTGDHVPPQSYFDKPLPTKPSIPQVPSCEDCQKRFKKAEDYVRTIVILGGAEQSTAGMKIEPAIIRMFAMRKDPGLVGKIEAASQRLTFVTPEGLFVGNRDVVDIDWAHVTLFTEKLIRGLYYIERRTALPTDVLIGRVDHFRGNDNFLAEHLAICRCGSLAWPGTFRYRWNIATKNPQVSLWWFVLYDTFVWHSMSFDADAELGWRERNKTRTNATREPSGDR